MANKRPKTKEETLKISGIKETKFNQYGQVFLDTIIDFDNTRTKNQKSKEKTNHPQHF